MSKKVTKPQYFRIFENEAPNLKDILNQLAGNITDAEMVDMTYALLE